MTKDELKAAFLEEIPVIAGGIEYAKISALIYRKHAGKIITQAELLGKNGNSVTIAQPEKVTLAGYKKGGLIRENHQNCRPVETGQANHYL